jgi:hypothetical protein
MIGSSNRKSFKSEITRTGKLRTEMTPFSMAIIMSGTVKRIYLDRGVLGQKRKHRTKRTGYIGQDI